MSEEQLKEFLKKFNRFRNRKGFMQAVAEDMALSNGGMSKDDVQWLIRESMFKYESLLPEKFKYKRVA